MKKLWNKFKSWWPLVLKRTLRDMEAQRDYAIRAELAAIRSKAEVDASAVRLRAAMLVLQESPQFKMAWNQFACQMSFGPDQEAAALALREVRFIEVESSRTLYVMCSPLDVAIGPVKRFKSGIAEDVEMARIGMSMAWKVSKYMEPKQGRVAEVELHLPRRRYETIRQFYEWYGKVTGRGVSAYI